MHLKYKKMAIYLILAIFFVILDRFFKIYAIDFLSDDGIRLFYDIFTLKLAKNYYIAFSIPFSGSILLFCNTIIILFLIYYWLKLVKNDNIKIAGLLTFLIFGAISNMVDRLKYSYVVDYFDLKYFTVFNLADVMIVISTIYICFILIKTKERKLKKIILDEETRGNALKMFKLRDFDLEFGDEFVTAKKGGRSKQIPNEVILKIFGPITEEEKKNKMT